MNHVLSRSDRLEPSRGEGLHRRRTAKVISPSPSALLSLEGKNHPDLARSPKSHLSLNRAGGGFTCWQRLASSNMKILIRELSGRQRPCATKAQPCLCYTVLGITKVSRRLGGNQVPFSLTHFLENPLLTVTAANSTT